MKSPFSILNQCDWPWIQAASVVRVERSWLGEESSALAELGRRGWLCNSCASNPASFCFLTKSSDDPLDPLDPSPEADEALAAAFSLSASSSLSRRRSSWTKASSASASAARGELPWVSW